MVQIKQADYQKISTDYRGMWNGKRFVFAGCIMHGGGMRLAVEGIDFEIVPTPKIVTKTSRRNIAR